MVRLMRSGLHFVLILAAIAASNCALAQQRHAAIHVPIPVILDTDIGDDIDDTWALGFLLRCPELDLKLVVGDNGKVEYRARLLARFLERAGRTNVAVGLGVHVERKNNQRQEEWIKGYDSKRIRAKSILMAFRRSSTP